MAMAMIHLNTLAYQLRDQIYQQMDTVVPTEISLERGYARLGKLLAEFKACEGWRVLLDNSGVPVYRSFDDFMLELRDRYNRGRTQLYQFCSVAEKLLPLVSADKLDEMGISKATEIKRALSGRPERKLTPELVATACDPQTTIKQLRAVLAETFNITDDTRPTGQWFDFGGAFLTKEERDEFVETVKITTALLNLKNDIPDHIQRKEIFLAWAAEFRGTHAVEVYGESTQEESNA